MGSHSATDAHGTLDKGRMRGNRSMVYHYVVHPLCSTSRHSHYGGVGMDGVGLPGLVVRQQSWWAEHNAFLHPVYLLLSRLGELNAVEEAGVVWISDTELLIECMMYRVDCIERVIVDDGGCGGGATVYSLQVLLLTFMAGDDNDRSHVQST